MLKLVAPALAVVAAIYFMKHHKKEAEQDADRIDDALEAGAYPGE